jgi:hypothetical protein
LRLSAFSLRRVAIALIVDIEGPEPDIDRAFAAMERKQGTPAEVSGDLRA